MNIKQSTPRRPRSIRRCRRIPFRMVFNLTGTDCEGKPFEEEIETQEISSQGGRFYSKHELVVGSTVKIRALRPHPFVSLVRIVWVVEEQNAYSVGFQLLESREDWVLRSNRKATEPGEYFSLS